jgi:hypothetical protein
LQQNKQLLEQNDIVWKEIWNFKLKENYSDDESSSCDSFESDSEEEEEEE